MRRPEVELSDAAARYVEDHPAVIEKLAAGVPAESDQERRAVIRGRIRDYFAATRTPEALAEAKVAGDAWLAKYGLTSAQVQ